MRSHDDTYRRIPAARIVDDAGNPLLSWRVRLLPFLGEMDLYNEFQLDEAWDSPHNKTLIDRMPAVFRRPGAKAQSGLTSYQTVRLEGAIIEYDDRVVSNGEQYGFQPIKYEVSFRMLPTFDGPSTTLLLVETPDNLAVIWTKPEDYTPPAVNPVTPLCGVYDDFLLAVFCDASVQRLRYDIPADLFHSLVTYHGHEELTADDLARAFVPK